MKYRPPPKETVLYVDPMTGNYDGPGMLCYVNGVMFMPSYPPGVTAKYQGEFAAYFSKAGGVPDRDPQGQIVGYDAIKRLVRQKAKVRP